MISDLEVQFPSYSSLAYVPPPSVIVFPGEDRKPAPQMIKPMNIAPINFKNITEEEIKEENHLPPSSSSHAAITGMQMPV